MKKVFAITVAFALLGLGGMAQAYVLTDEFTDNYANPGLWNSFATGGTSIAEVNQRVEVNIPAASAGDTFAAGYLSSFQLRGDFDIQIDYALLTWPSASGVRTGLEVLCGGVLISVQRGNRGSAQEEYYIDYGSGPRGTVTTSDTTGGMRLVRSGATLSGYYRHTGAWVNLYSNSVNTSDVRVELAGWSHDYLFGDKRAVVAFDNFAVNQGQVIAAVPEPSSFFVLLCGIGGLGRTSRLGRTLRLKRR